MKTLNNYFFGFEAPETDEEKEAVKFYYGCIATMILFAFIVAIKIF